MAVSSTFDPTKHLRKLNGKDYLEVVHRLQWLRAEHPDAVITTKLEQVDFEAGWAIFHARVEIPTNGVAEGTGSETRQAFPSGWLEKAETIAIGRALAALGYGTAFCLDFETVDETGNGHLADSPLERPSTPGIARPEPIPIRPSNLASPAQLKLIYLTAKRDGHMLESELEDWCRERYGRTPSQLTKSEASTVIDLLKQRGVRHETN